MKFFPYIFVLVKGISNKLFVADLVLYLVVFVFGIKSWKRGTEFGAMLSRSRSQSRLCYVHM